jgi:hypothetical protein
MSLTPAGEYVAFGEEQIPSWMPEEMRRKLMAQMGLGGAAPPTQLQQWQKQFGDAYQPVLQQAQAYLNQAEDRRTPAQQQLETATGQQQGRINAMAAGYGGSAAAARAGQYASGRLEGQQGMTAQTIQAQEMQQGQEMQQAALLQRAQLEQQLHQLDMQNKLAKLDALAAQYGINAQSSIAQMQMWGKLGGGALQGLSTAGAGWAGSPSTPAGPKSPTQTDKNYQGGGGGYYG